VATPSYFKGVAEILLRRVTLVLPAIMARYPAVPPYLCQHLLNWKWCSSRRDEALEKVKAFFYAHNVTDADHENILSLEKSYFQLRQNSAKKQKTMYDVFCLKKVVFWINRFPTFIVCFLHSLEKR
jgi:hypothetical protein